jgi:uncharacterized protein (TIGR04141 family)
LTIYLIKEELANPDAIVIEKSGVERYALKSGNRSIGDLYVERRRPQPPRWTRFFKGYLDPRQLGQVASAAAVLLLKARERLFAITFGHGRHLLDPDAWEERFGLRVALNSIGEKNVRSIDKRTFDSISRHSREQASREASARDFQLDVEQDLLRAITGTPTDSDLGRRMSGMDALHAAIPADIESLRDLVSLYLDKYLDTSYLSAFPWVDHIAEISKRTIVDQLDSLVVEKIAVGDVNGIWMAVPEPIDWQGVDGFQWSGRQQPLHHDIHLDGFLASVPEVDSITPKTLRQRKVTSLNDDGLALASWQAYRCLHAQLDHEGDTFLLSGGKWYRLTRDFVTDVNEAYRRIPRYEHPLPEYDDASETAYNKRVAEGDPARYALLDARELGYGGGRSSVEFCDLFVNGQDGHDIVHIKRYGASSLLSHLFSQGLISGEIFQTDPDFRRRVNDMLPKGHRISNPEQRPPVDKYRVVFAVVSDVAGDLTLPFFSRLNAKHAARRLAGLGYRVAMAKISVNEMRSKLKRYT